VLRAPFVLWRSATIPFALLAPMKRSVSSAPCYRQQILRIFSVNWEDINHGPKSRRGVHELAIGRRHASPDAGLHEHQELPPARRLVQAHGVFDAHGRERGPMAGLFRRVGAIGRLRGCDRPKVPDASLAIGAGCASLVARVAPIGIVSGLTNPGRDGGCFAASYLGCQNYSPKLFEILLFGGSDEVPTDLCDAGRRVPLR
jgi:hypothetical protein